MSETQKITFLGTDYTKKGLETMEASDLLSLRNLIADNLGVSKVKSLETGKEAENVWKALTHWETKMSEEEKSAKSDAPIDTEKPNTAAKNKKPPTPAKEKKPKGSREKFPKSVTKEMFRRVKWLKEKPEKGYRQERIHLYTNGTRVIDAMVSKTMEHTDLPFYEKEGLIELTWPSDLEFEKEAKEFCESYGIKAPGQKKAEEEEALKNSRENRAEQAKNPQPATEDDG